MIDISDQMQLFHGACELALNHFFADYPDEKLEEELKKACRFLVVSGDPLKGDPAGWAAGLVFWKWKEKALFGGLPGVSNADFERCFGVTMSTIRKRGAQAKSILIL